MTKTELLAVAKPILFNTEMVRAILENRKTVTRRVIKKKHVDNVLNSSARLGNIDTPDERFITCLCDEPYEKGDILYVRETWQIDSINDKTNEMLINFKALQENYSGMQIDCNFSPVKYKQFRKFYKKHGWQSPCSMPKETARIFLRVNDVRVKRLWDMSEEQAKMEGIFQLTGCSERATFPHVFEFLKLWDSTIKKADINTYGSDANPWVWVIEFERIREE